MTLQRIKQTPLWWFYIVGVLLLLVAGWFWWARLSVTPERAFNGMLKQSLSSTGVTMQASETTNGVTAKQTVQYSLSGNSMSHSITELSQTGTTVVDEMIGTSKGDYTRYKSIVTTQKSKSGKPLDVSKVVGVWAKSPLNTTGSTLFSQAMLGTSLPLGGIVVPIGSPTAAQRSALLKEIKADKVYQPSYKNVQRKWVAGRLQYTYNVTISAQGYVKLLKNFAQTMGLHDLDQVNPANYKGQPDLKVAMTIDAHAGHLVKVSLANNPYAQTYTSYDIPVNVAVPAKTVTTDELQKRLQKMQQ